MAKCRTCGQDNPAEARFCGGCGAVLVAVAEPRVTASAAQVATAAPPVALAEYAGFGRRLAAAVIDGLIIQAATIFLPVGSGIIKMHAPILLNVTVGSLTLTLPWLYLWLFTGFKGQTPGKMALGIRVVGNERKLGLGTAALREIVGKIVSLIPVFLGFLWILWDSEQQGWHDKIAHTHVVRVANGR